MCSIVGMIGHVPEGRWGQTYGVLAELLKVSECRGTDATGFAALTQPLRQRDRFGMITDKEPLRATSFVGSSNAWRCLSQRRAVAVLGHTRMATRGDPKLRKNAHPFSSSGGLHLAHNGCLSNDDVVAREFGLRLHSDTDSECLLRFIEAVGDPLEGLDLCLRHIHGTMAIAMLDQSEHVIWLARRDRPLWLCRLRGERRWWFASTAEILLHAFNHVLPARWARPEFLAPIPERTPLALSVDGLVTAPTCGR